MPRPGNRFTPRTEAVLEKAEMYELCKEFLDFRNKMRRTDSFGSDISKELMELYNAFELQCSSIERAATRTMNLAAKEIEVENASSNS